MAFNQKLKARPRNKCKCFDCLRKDGLTPPRKVLHKHKPLYGELPENPYV